MHMNRLGVTIVFAVMTGVVSPALAHDGHDHIIMGTVMGLDAKHVAVKTPSGEVLSIAVTDKTTTTRDKKKIAFKEVQVGRRVVVNIGNGEDPLIAKDIQLGAALPASAAKH
jgi:hypothetical protein